MKLSLGLCKHECTTVVVCQDSLSSWKGKPVSAGLKESGCAPTPLPRMALKPGCTPGTDTSLEQKGEAALLVTPPFPGELSPNLQAISMSMGTGAKVIK